MNNEVELTQFIRQFRANGELDETHMGWGKGRGPHNGGSRHIVTLSPAAAVTLERFRRVFTDAVIEPEQQRRFAAVKVSTNNDGFVTHALTLQPKNEEGKFKEMQPLALLLFICKGLLQSGPFVKNAIDVWRLSYKNRVGNPTAKRYDDFLGEIAAQNSLHEHSLPTENGLVAVTAPAAVQPQNYAASSASPQQLSTAIVVPGCETLTK